MADFIGFIEVVLMIKLSGAVVAMDYVGQRDTRWLTPLTVSGGYQGEEGNHQISGACSYPTAASAFYILGHGSTIRFFQKEKSAVVVNSESFRHSITSIVSTTRRISVISSSLCRPADE